MELYIGIYIWSMMHDSFVISIYVFTITYNEWRIYMWVEAAWVDSTVEVFGVTLKSHGYPNEPSPKFVGGGTIINKLERSAKISYI